MKKIAFLTSCFVGLGLMMPGAVRAGDLFEITARVGENFFDSNEYTRLANGNYIECDDDDGDAGDGVVIYSVIDQTPVARECVIEWNGDFWKVVEFPECRSSNCDGETEDLGNGRKFCSNGVDYRYIGGSFVAASSGACWYED